MPLKPWILDTYAITSQFSFCHLIQEDSKLERVGSFLGITKTDHNPEIFNQTTVLRVDSLPTAEVGV